MVVTDLHGDWPLYARYRDVFLALRARGLAETLVVTGDFIHSDGPEDQDASMAIVMDLMALQAELGPRLIVLLGNHELPHIYHATLSKGEQLYTPRFERAMGEQRAAVLSWFDGLPFYVRTRAGVSLCHAGAFEETQQATVLELLADFSHQAVLDAVVAAIPPDRLESIRCGLGKAVRVPYADVMQYYFGVSDPADPRYDDFLIGFLAGTHTAFQRLWAAFFTGNEKQYGEEKYARHLAAFLAVLGAGFAPQKVLVTGHIGCRGGYQGLFGGRQLRVASGAHSHPYEQARYLLFDAGRPVAGAEDLFGGIGSVFER